MAALRRRAPRCHLHRQGPNSSPRGAAARTSASSSDEEIFRLDFDRIADLEGNHAEALVTVARFPAAIQDVTLISRVVRGRVCRTTAPLGAGIRAALISAAPDAWSTPARRRFRRAGLRRGVRGR